MKNWLEQTLHKKLLQASDLMNATEIIERHLSNCNELYLYSVKPLEWFFGKLGSKEWSLFLRVRWQNFFFVSVPLSDCMLILSVHLMYYVLFKWPYIVQTLFQKWMDFSIFNIHIPALSNNFVIFSLLKVYVNFNFRSFMLTLRKLALWWKIIFQFWPQKTAMQLHQDWRQIKKQLYILIIL